MTIQTEISVKTIWNNSYTFAAKIYKEKMKFRTLGMSGLRVSAVGLVCMGMSHAYGAPADKDKMMELLAEEEIKHIDQALDTMKMSEVFGGSKVVGMDDKQ